MVWQGPIRKIDQFRYQIDPDYQNSAMKKAGVRMNVPGLIYTSERMLRDILKDNSPDQVANVATLPGIVGHSIAMPDIHHGYGFAIGGVAAFDVNHGIISPGGVGYDINCGVRLLRTDLTVEDISPKVADLVNAIFDFVPCGVGSVRKEKKEKLNQSELDQLLAEGARWVVRQGFGREDDLVYTETAGGFSDGNPDDISRRASERGLAQLGTLGAGNHFIEIQRVDQIYNQVAAETFGITSVGQVTVMIHTGSRGLGHQVCDDYLALLRKSVRKYGIPLVDPQLVCAPASSPEGEQYFSAMQCAANFAWGNRQMITHQVRRAFEKVLESSADQLRMDQIYDIAHNIARLERHQTEKGVKNLFVHRKGATRAFPPEHPELPEKYKLVGQPVIIPGSMGTASYLLLGTEGAMKHTFGSSCHGAGRVLSRHQSIKTHRVDQVLDEMKQLNIELKAKSRRVIQEEAPGAYKNIDQVVEVSDRSGLAQKVVRLCPIGVVKG